MFSELSVISTILKAIDDPTLLSNAGGAIDMLRTYGTGPSSISKRSKMSIYEYPFAISDNLSDIELICSCVKSMEVEYSHMLLLAMGVDPTINGKKGVEITRKLSQYHNVDTTYSKMARESAVIGFSDKSLSAQMEAAGATQAAPAGSGATSNAQAAPTASGPTNSAAPSASVGNAPNGQGNGSGNRGGGYNGGNKNDKKANEAKEIKIDSKYATMFNATMISVSLRLGDTKDTEITIPIGVKGIPHVVRAADLDYVIQRFVSTGRNGLLNRFIRWRSGELKGFGNLLFRYNEIRADANFDKRVGTNHSWLKVLKDRAMMYKSMTVAKVANKLGGDGNYNFVNNLSEPVAEFSFIITLDDVTAIEDETGVNIFTNVHAASKFLDESMGLGLVIVDEAASIINILYSGYSKYATYPLSAVKSKLNKDGDLTKIMLDLMKKV